MAKNVANGGPVRRSISLLELLAVDQASRCVEFFAVGRRPTLGRDGMCNSFDLGLEKSGLTESDFDSVGRTPSND